MTSLYTEATASEICNRISKGETLASISRLPGMPQPATVGDWTRHNQEFAARYSQARKEGFDAIAENLRETSRGAGDSSGDVQRDKLIVDTDLKLLAKWDPKRYGEKLDVNATVAGEIRIVVGGDTE
jgi:hypothetical protein